jgi:hypothetical protein
MKTEQILIFLILCVNREVFTRLKSNKNIPKWKKQVRMEKNIEKPLKQIFLSSLEAFQLSQDFLMIYSRFHLEILFVLTGINFLNFFRHARLNIVNLTTDAMRMATSNV